MEESSERESENTPKVIAQQDHNSRLNKQKSGFYRQQSQDMHLRNSSQNSGASPKNKARHDAHNTQPLSSAQMSSAMGAYQSDRKSQTLKVEGANPSPNASLRNRSNQLQVNT